MTIDWLDLVAGAGIGAVAALGLRVLLGSLRSRGGGPQESSAPAPVPPAMEARPAAGTPPAVESRGAENHHPQRLSESPHPSTPVTVTTASTFAPGRSEGGGTVGAETLRLSQRVVLHVYRQGVLGPYEVAPVELCQLGIVRSLGVRQSALTKVLTRLEAAGVLSTDRRHVEGQPRRLKVYQLTPLGESLARDLRRTFPAQFMTEPNPAQIPPIPSGR